MNCATPIQAVSRHAFSQYARDVFAACYPETPHKIRHGLADNPLLSLDALAELGGKLPKKSVSTMRGDVPIGGRSEPGDVDISIGETIRRIEHGQCRVALKNVEHVPAYADLLAALAGDLKPAIEARTGSMLDPRACIYIAGPEAVVPFHFDPEHRLSVQVAGSQTLTQFPAGDSTYAPDEAYEAFRAGKRSELAWRKDFIGGGTDWGLQPGDAVFVPVMAPHFVRAGPQGSISLALSWRSDWSRAEADARAFNAFLRRWKITPRPPGRWPESNRGKALCWRLFGKIAPTR